MYSKKQTIIMMAIAVVIIALYENYDKFKIKAQPAIKASSTVKQADEIPIEETIKDTIKLPILMYHYVEYIQDKNDFIRKSLNIEPHIFESQIITLREAGYTFITPNKLDEIFNNIENPDKKYVIISFDDGYEDFYRDVFPVLKKYNITSINYLVNNFINKPNYLKDHQIQEIADSGLVEIGSHTLNHRYLTILNEEKAFIEISESKSQLEQKYNISVSSFAYPYGAYNQEIIDLVKAAGFNSAVSTSPGNIIYKDKLYELNRIRPGHNIGDSLIGYIENP